MRKSSRNFRATEPADLAAETRFAALWRFSLMVYARPGMAEALIGLQDRRGIDVNVVLCCLWRVASGWALRARDVTAMAAAAAGWQRRVVRPLRRVRRALKADPGAQRLRRAVQKVEIEAEKAEQRLLAALPVESAPPVSRATACRLARARLGAYLKIDGSPPSARDRAAIALVVDVALAGNQV